METIEHAAIERLVEALLAMPREEWDALADKTEVPRSTIEKIAYRVTSNPSFASVERLRVALRLNGSQ
jgi:hypothetical protein